MHACLPQICYFIYRIRIVRARTLFMLQCHRNFTAIQSSQLKLNNNFSHWHQLIHIGHCKHVVLTEKSRQVLNSLFWMYIMLFFFLKIARAKHDSHMCSSGDAWKDCVPVSNSRWEITIRANKKKFRVVHCYVAVCMYGFFSQKRHKRKIVYTRID